MCLCGEAMALRYLERHSRAVAVCRCYVKIIPLQFVNNHNTKSPLVLPRWGQIYEHMKHAFAPRKYSWPLCEAVYGENWPSSDDRRT